MVAPDAGGGATTGAGGGAGGKAAAAILADSFGSDSELAALAQVADGNPKGSVLQSGHRRVSNRRDLSHLTTQSL